VTTAEVETEAATARRSAAEVAGRPAAVAAGATLAELFEAHGRMVLGLCRLLLRDPVEAEDAAQEVFVSAHRSPLGGVVPRDPPAWIAAIARNECRRRIRARMREPLALPELPDDLPDPLASAVRAADLDALWTALAELPRRQRKAFLLRELGGLSYRELGAALGVSGPAVESLLFRARRYLRGALAGPAFVPLGLRDQLAQLLPGFGGASSAAAVPVAAKLVAVTAGIGLVATGAAELPQRHVLTAQAAAPVPVAAHQHARAAVPPRQAAATVPVALRTRVRSEPERRRYGRIDRVATHDRQERGREAPESNQLVPEPEHRDGVQAEPQQEDAAAVVDDHGASFGDRESSGDGGSGGDSARAEAAATPARTEADRRKTGAILASPRRRSSAGRALHS
jgi:RNA polymerase sigma-70 factor, ECF subfamily